MSEIKKFAELMNASRQAQQENRLMILDALFAKAVAEKDWAAALKIQAEAANVLKTIAR